MMNMKQCYFCTHARKPVDWRDAQTLRKFISPQGKILPARYTKTCAKHQRKLATAIKRARIMALLPFTISAM